MERYMRSVCCILIIVVMLVSVVGCSATGNNTTAANPGSSNSTSTESMNNDEPIELVWATFKGGWVDVLEEIFAKYEAEHPNVKISIYTGQSGDFFGDLKALQATNSLPNIFNLRGDNFGREWKEYLQDVSDSSAIANVKDGFTDAFDWDGVTYGAYYNYEIHGSTWNMNVLKSLGYDSYPTSNSEYLQVINDLKTAGYTGLAYFANAQSLYNHLGNAPLVLHDNPSAFYSDLVNGTADPVNDQYFNQYFDWISASLPYLNENPVTMDDSTARSTLFTTNDYAWEILDGTTGAYYSYDTDYTDVFEIGPLCINDGDPYYVLNCQGYVVSNTGDEATNKAALDLYNWFFTNDEVADTLTKAFSILTTSKTYALDALLLDPFTFKAYQQIQSFDFKPITYYMPGSLTTEYASIQQKFITGEMSKEEALTAVGEAFRNLG